MSTCLIAILLITYFHISTTQRLHEWKICRFEDSIKSCECYFDGQHFSVQCTYTQLDALPKTADLPKDVELLDVSHNKIKKLEFDNEKYESKLMRIFRASHNYIDALPSKFLVNLPHLTTMDLSHNQITQVEAEAFATVGSLHTLDLSFNNIHVLPPAIFARARILRYLDLSYNDLGEQLKELKSLNASGLGFNGNMQVLKLNALNLTKVSNAYFEQLSLQSLELTDNALTEIPHLPSTLVELDLSGNGFSTIAPRDFVLPLLKTLRLNRMPDLVDMENYALYNLLALEVLEIEHCPMLKSLNDKTFGVIVDKEKFNLTRISLNGNSLRRINDTYFHLFNQAAEVDLSSNPWICDCGVIWFNLIKPKLINKPSIKCVAPKRLRNHQILDLDVNSLPKCNVEANIRVQKILTSVICILVVILLGVIMYLIYLVPYRGNRSERIRGPQSPYNDIVIGDDHL